MEVDRNLLNAKFNGYKLKVINDTVTKKHLVDDYKPFYIVDSKKYSFCHVKFKCTENSLFVNEFSDPMEVFYISVAGYIIQIDYMDSKEIKYCGEIKEGRNESFIFNPSMKFTKLNYCIISNGYGEIILYKRTNKTVSNFSDIQSSHDCIQPASIEFLKICLIDKFDMFPFRLLDINFNPKTQYFYYCLLTIDKKITEKDTINNNKVESKYYIKMAVYQANLITKDVSKTLISNKKLYELDSNDIPHNLKIDLDGSIIGFFPQFCRITKFIENTVEQIRKTIDSNLFGDLFEISWSQNDEYINLICNFLKITPKKEELVVNLSPKSISIAINNNNININNHNEEDKNESNQHGPFEIFKGTFCKEINVMDSKWTLNNKIFELTVFKKQPNDFWNDLMDKPANSIKHLIDGSEQDYIDSIVERLSPYTSSSYEAPQQPNFNQYELEDCDVSTDEQLFLVTVDRLFNLKIENLPYKWLFDCSKGDNLSICLKNDVDGVIFTKYNSILLLEDKNENIQISPSEFKHTSTFDAIGYVLASKPNGRFIQSNVQQTFVVFVDSNKRVFQYFKPTISQNVSNKSNWRNDATQITFHFDQQIMGTLIGFYAFDNYLLFLTEYCFHLGLINI